MSYFGLVRDHFGECAVEGLLYFGLVRELPGVLKSQVLKIQQPHSPTGGKQAFVGLINTLLRVNSRVSAKIILVLGPNFGNPQSHGSKTPNRLRKFRNGTCNSNNLEQKYGNTGLSTLHFRTLQIFTITQTRKID